MVIRFTDRATRDYAKLPAGVRKAPNDESRVVWRARVSRNWRFYFTVHGDAYVILAVIPHPK